MNADMQYEVGQIVQFGYLHKQSFHVMVGKIEQAFEGKSKEFDVRLAEASTFPHKNEDESEVEVIRVPLRMLGKIIDADSPSDSLVFNGVYKAPIGALVRVTNLEYDRSKRTKGRLLGMSFEDNRTKELSYYILLKRQNDDFAEFSVDLHDERGGVFAKLHPKKQVIEVNGSQIIGVADISEKDRTDVKLYQRTYMKALWERVAAMGLVRRVIKAVHTIPGKEDDHWYAFTTDDHYTDCSSCLKGVNTTFLRLDKDYPHEIAARPEKGDVILTIPLENRKKRECPPVAYIPAKEHPGLDVFNTFVLSGGGHKIFTNRTPMQIVAMCEQVTENGRLPTPFSLLVQGYFHKNFRADSVDAFRELHLWHLA